MIGKVYNIPPQPPVPENTRPLPAGAITFTVEYRELDPGSLNATYAGNAEHLAELQERSPEGGFTDEGVSIHVLGTDDGHEYLRFDVFDGEPHYHYIHPAGGGPDGEAEPINNIIDFDANANGEMLPWAIERLRTRLPEMRSEAGGAHLIAKIDAPLVKRVIDDVAAMAQSAQQAHRAAVGR